MTDTILEIRDLTVSFRTERGLLHAVRGVSIGIPRNSVFGIVGESGCGKSTLASSVLSLLAPSANVEGGQIEFDGLNLLGLPEHKLRDIRGKRIAMVFQDPMTALNPVLSIGRQLLDIQYRDPLPKREKMSRAADMLRRVGIPDPLERLKQFPHQFSGGMRQRIAIGMALLMQPALLIADEPTTALDATLEAQIAQLFLELKEDFDGSILFVSHNLGLVAELCDHAAVMYAGQIVETGPIGQIFAAPSHPYTQLLLDCDPARVSTKRAELPTIPGVVADLIDVPKGCIFAARCPKVRERCRVEAPMSRSVGGTHFARCHLVDDA